MGDSVANHEVEVQRILASSPSCSNRLCIEFRIQHQKATAVRLELENRAKEWESKYQQLHDRLLTRGFDMASREGSTGEVVFLLFSSCYSCSRMCVCVQEGFRMPNGESMSVERVMELSRMLNIVRSSMQKTETRCSKIDNMWLTQP